MLTNFWTLRALRVAALICAVSLGLSGCERARDGREPTDDAPDHEHEGESDARFDSNAPPPGYSFAGDGDDGGDGDGDGDGDGQGPRSPLEAVQEADVIQRSGDRLFALSRVFGLSIIDVSTPEQLVMLGQRRLSGGPREMYVRDGVVLALVDAELYPYGTRLLVLDASDPAAIVELDEHALQGHLVSSRMLGDVLYIVARGAVPCWACPVDDGCARCDRSYTSLVSLDVRDPRRPRVIERLSFDDQPGDYGGPVSIAVTPERTYVAIPGDDQGMISDIQVVDISAGTGAMRLGAKIKLEGQIESRWQMDEHEGVLRVVSQRWRFDDPPPVIETFRIESSDALTPLGRAELILPRPEDLRAVRFDGERAYAITFERTDPLFTIDLSDPASPRQAGELEIPGWVEHMEPRGDRLIGIGFEPWHPDGALHVSLFDVGDMSAPRMIERVRFGGQRGEFAERDQNRIHQAFSILDEQGLIVVPFNSFPTEELPRCDEPSHGVQLVQLERDSLRAAGLMAVRGSVRRAVPIDTRLISVTDEHVEAFDIADPAAPKPLSGLALGRYTRMTATFGEHVLRLAQEGSSARYALEVVPRAMPGGAPTAVVGLDLREPYALSDTCVRPTRVELVVDGAYVHVAYALQGNRAALDGIATVDLGDPDEPRLAGYTSIAQPELADDSWRESELRAFSGGFAHLAFEWRYDGPTDRQVITGARLQILDLAEPSVPVVTPFKIALPARQLGLVAHGAQAYLSRMVDVGDGAVRHLLERFDLRAPERPRRLAPIAVPGMVAGVIGADRILTKSYEIERDDTAKRTCDTLGPRGGFHDLGASEVCSVWRERLSLVRLERDRAVLEASHRIDRDSRITALAMNEQRIFVALDDWRRSLPTPENVLPMLVLSGMGEGRLEGQRLRMNGDLAKRWWRSGAFAVEGTRSVWTEPYARDELAIIDASDPSAPTGNFVPAPRGIEHVTLEPERALGSRGSEGVAVVDL